MLNHVGESSMTVDQFNHMMGISEGAEHGGLER